MCWFARNSFKSDKWLNTSNSNCWYNRARSLFELLNYAMHVVCFCDCDDGNSYCYCCTPDRCGVSVSLVCLLRNVSSFFADFFLFLLLSNSIRIVNHRRKWSATKKQKLKHKKLRTQRQKVEWNFCAII